MATNKTKMTEVSVEKYLSTIENTTRRKDCEVLSLLMNKVTKETPKMWGTSIVGFGSYHYKYASGHEGDSCLIGFASRKGDISIYLAEDFPGKVELLSKLGKHKLGKGCLYIRSLEDVDQKILEQLLNACFTQKKSQHS